jgi:hypothetical protein
MDRCSSSQLPAFSWSPRCSPADSTRSAGDSKLGSRRPSSCRWPAAGATRRTGQAWPAAGSHRTRLGTHLDLLFAFLAPNIAPDLLALLAEIHLSTDHRDLLLIWILIGGTLALIVFAITVISVPLLLDRHTDFRTAMRPVCAP